MSTVENEQRIGPCPHCGGTDVRVYQNVSGAWQVLQSGNHYRECTVCGFVAYVRA